MKELGIPAPKPEEINRRAFCKAFEKMDDGGWEDVEFILPHLQRLEDRGLVPQTVALKRGRKYLHVYMERVNGFELASFPKKHKDYKFSVDIAQKTASLFQGFFDAGYYHDDPHGSNIMYDTVGNRCVAVDLNSIETNSDHQIPLKKYINDYARLMATLYLGNYPLDVAVQLLDEGELRQKVVEYRKISDSLTVFDFILESSDLDDLELSELMRNDKLTSRINPIVRGFVLRGLDPSTAPDSFEEILGIQAPMKM